MNTKNFDYYKECFSSLHTMRRGGKPAPHKVLLLLSVIDLIERGVITNCRVPLSEELERKFKHNVSTLLGDSLLFQPRLSYPYYHLRSEPFWTLVSPNGNQVPTIYNYSTSNLRKHISYARIDEELFYLLQNPNVRAKLRVVLISTYLNNQPTLADNLSIWLLSLSYLTPLVA